MSWLENLKHLLKANFKINILSNNIITINRSEKPSVAGDIIYVPISLVRASLPEAINDGNTLLEEDTRVIFSDFSKRESEHKPTLDFFKKIIPPEDYQILRAALYLRYCFEKHDEQEKISKLRNDIYMRYGGRGSRICNLCTSRYFEDFFKPLYENMDEKSINSGEAQKRFLAIYELVVSRNNVLAIFINHAMNKEQVKITIEDAILTSKQYGIPRISIHGIGKQNCLNIKNSIRELEDIYSFTGDCAEEAQVISYTLKNISKR
jgi:hypothetical protein